MLWLMLSRAAASRPRLEAVEIAADPDAWRGCGFDVPPDAVFGAGGVAVQVAETGAGVRIRLSRPVAGLDRCEAAAAPQSVHPNGVTGIDHIVLATGSADEITAALVAAGAELRATRQARFGEIEAEQRFFPLPGGMIELVCAPSWPRPAAVWGITFECADPAGVAQRWPEFVPAPHDALQPGRTITTVTEEARLGTRVALISPRPRDR